MSENLALDAVSSMPPVEASFVAGLHPQLEAQLLQVQSQAQAQAQVNPGYGMGENGGGASADYSRDHLQVESGGQSAHSPDASAASAGHGATATGALFGPAALIGMVGTDERAAQNIDAHALCNSNWLIERCHDSSRQCALLIDFEETAVLLAELHVRVYVCREFKLIWNELSDMRQRQERLELAVEKVDSLFVCSFCFHLISNVQQKRCVLYACRW